MVFYKNLKDSKSPRVSWALPSILADLNKALVWRVSACALISKSSSPFTNPLGIVPNSSITIVITVTFVFLVLSAGTAEYTDCISAEG